MQMVKTLLLPDTHASLEIFTFFFALVICHYTASATYSAVVQGKTGNKTHPISAGSKTPSLTGSNKTGAISTGFTKTGNRLD